MVMNILDVLECETLCTTRFANISALHRESRAVHVTFVTGWTVITEFLVFSLQLGHCLMMIGDHCGPLFNRRALVEPFDAHIGALGGQVENDVRFMATGTIECRFIGIIIKLQAIKSLVSQYSPFCCCRCWCYVGKTFVLEHARLSTIPAQSRWPIAQCAIECTILGNSPFTITAQANAFLWNESFAQSNASFELLWICAGLCAWTIVQTTFASEEYGIANGRL